MIKTAPIKTVMVMAAGHGTRMRPLTNDRSKAMVEVAGRPLIDHMLDRLAEAGVERAIVNVHAQLCRSSAMTRYSFVILTRFGTPLNLF